MKKYDLLESIQTRDTGRRVPVNADPVHADWHMRYINDSLPRKLEYVHRVEFGCHTVVSDSRTGDRDPVAESRDAATRLIAEAIYGDVRRDLLGMLTQAYERGEEETARNIRTMLNRMTP